MNILIIGAGFLGSSIAYKLKKEHTVTVSKTSLDPSLDLNQINLSEKNYHKIPSLVKKADCIIVTVAPRNKQNYRSTYSTIAHAIYLELKNMKNKTLIFTSSTSVYKENQGHRVTESSPLDLQQADVLIEAEKTFLKLVNHRVVIARLSGLFGQERQLEAMVKGFKDKPMGEKKINLCSKDLATLFICYAVKYPIGGIFNVSLGAILNTWLYEMIYHKKPLVDKSITQFTHGGSKEVDNTKISTLIGFPFKSIQAQDLHYLQMKFDTGSPTSF